jgi:hypothetical protein
MGTIFIIAVHAQQQPEQTVVGQQVPLLDPQPQTAQTAVGDPTPAVQAPSNEPTALTASDAAAAATASVAEPTAVDGTSSDVTARAGVHQPCQDQLGPTGTNWDQLRTLRGLEKRMVTTGEHARLQQQQQ